MLLLIGIFISYFTFVKSTSPDSGLNGLYSLVERRLPLHRSTFDFQLIEGDGDSFHISDSGKETAPFIDIRCTTISACSRGLYTYLTEYGGVDIYWTGSRLHELSFPPPAIGNPRTGSSIVPYRYYFNTVTFSYTTAFYDFEQWSLLLDWLSLRGVNLPLAWVGNEHFIVEVFKEVGLNDSSISDFLSGPAFQAWNRFGNIQGSWEGALPYQWISDQFSLQKNIIQRMVELGMTPILPAFTGYVPRDLSLVYPNASVVKATQWDNFPSLFTEDTFLNPFDPLYSKIQNSFISKQIEAYGNVSHVYTLDQFNEILPSSGEPEYLHNVSAATFQSLRAADPSAVWLMQGWLFLISPDFWTLDRISAYLDGVPGDDGMIILDLFSEVFPVWELTYSYFGKPWIWCQLHDFGGNQGLEGNLLNATRSPIEALNSSNSSMRGVGLTMEGQEGNEIVYDILLDQAWSTVPINTSIYVQDWVSRRYNVHPLPPIVQDAWGILASTIYNNSGEGVVGVTKSIFELAPALSGLIDRTGIQPTMLFYDTNTTIVPVLSMLFNASQQNPALQTIPEFALDVVEVGRQLLANRFIDAYNHLVATYNDTSTTGSDVRCASQPLMAILSDLDDLLYTNEHFLLSKWISDARSWARNSTDADYASFLEYNARNQITLWGPDGEIDDYASKQWAGLVGTYYIPRWQLFAEYLEETKSFGSSSFNSTHLTLQLLSLGTTWDKETWGMRSGEVWGTKGDTWEVIESILHLYI